MHQSGAASGERKADSEDARSLVFRDNAATNEGRRGAEKDPENEAPASGVSREYPGVAAVSPKEGLEVRRSHDDTAEQEVIPEQGQQLREDDPGKPGGQRYLSSPSHAQEDAWLSQPPVTFHDVAACFSEEEWKLLHKWQKELYQNVMTELHLSVISLGPLIAASVFSVKPKEEEGNGHVDFERRCNINHFKRLPSFTSDNDGSIQEQLKEHLIGYSDVKGRECINSPSSGPVDEDVFTVPDISLKIKYEGNQYPKTHLNTERTESLNPFRGDDVANSNVECKKERKNNQLLKDLLDPDRVRSKDMLSTGPGRDGLSDLTSDNTSTLGQELNVNGLDTQMAQSCTIAGSLPLDGVPAVLSRIKEEKNTACVNPLDPERTKNTKPCSMVAMQETLTCGGAEGLQAAWGYPFVSGELEVKAWDLHNIEGCESLSGPGSGTSVMTQEGPLNVVSEDAYSMNKQHSERWECTTSPTGNSTSLPYTKQEARNWQRTCKQSEYGRNVSPNLNQIRQPRILHGEEGYKYLDYNNGFNQRTSHVKIQDHHPIDRTVESDCGKTSSESANLTQQPKTQTGVKLYICTQCGNYFSQSANANPHHPSTCSECDKRMLHTVNQKKSKRKRTEKTSHVCRECGKICRHSQALRLHQRVHTGEKPHACGECGRCFSVMANLIRHRRIHTGEKPYTCSVCGKNFRQLPHLIKHQRTHMREEMLMLRSREIS
ncbi:uncharacterized protein LOC144762609 [Lissotriton helveticus]